MKVVVSNQWTAHRVRMVLYWMALTFGVAYLTISRVVPYIS